jgi:hypothetical protein
LNPSIVHTCIKIIFVAHAWAKNTHTLAGTGISPSLSKTEAGASRNIADMNIFFQRKAFSECFCHDSNNDSGNVFRWTNTPRKDSWLLWHFQSLFYNAEHYKSTQWVADSYLWLFRSLLNVSSTRHTKNKCRIDQQYIFHWWSFKIFKTIKKITTPLLTRTPSLI